MVNFMIYDFEVKRQNKEEILYLYLDIGQEFAKLNVRNKKKKLKEMIREYMEGNNIVFKGTTVAILVGGLIVGTLTLKNPKESLSHSTTSRYAISALLHSKEEPMEIKVEEKKEINTNEEEKLKKSSIETIQKVTSAKKSSSENNDVSAFTKVENKIEESKTIVNIYRKNGSILNLELEEYVIGVVGAEMPAAFPMEALKAQAVLARTYALKSLENEKRLTDNSSTQNYKSNEELKKIWGNSFSTYYNKIKRAVAETKGMYLTYKGEIIDAVYHSTSNGATEDAKNVWGNAVPYLVSVSSPYDASNSSFQKETTFTYEALSQKIGVKVTEESSFLIISKTEGNRILELSIDNQVYNGVIFRNLLGLRSASFEIVKEKEGVRVVTYGFGHGVGMSQYGASGMAKNGSSFKDILKHYYKGVTLSYK